MSLKLKLFHDIFDRSVQPLEELEYVAEEEDTSDAWHNVGIAYFQKLKFHLAVRAFSKALERNPNSIDIYFHRGVSQVIMGKFGPAIDDFTRVLEQKPDHFGALYNRGRLRARLRQYHDAIEDFERAQSINRRQAGKLHVPRAVRIVTRRAEGREPHLFDRIRDWLDQRL